MPAVLTGPQLDYLAVSVDIYAEQSLLLREARCLAAHLAERVPAITAATRLFTSGAIGADPFDAIVHAELESRFGATPEVSKVSRINGWLRLFCQEAAA